MSSVTRMSDTMTTGFNCPPLAIPELNNGDLIRRSLDEAGPLLFAFVCYRVSSFTSKVA